jgi:hypothetical protein
MATRIPTVTYNPNGHVGTVQVVWTGLLNTDVGAPVELPGYADRSVQLTGTLGVGGNCKIEGSADATTYALLSDPQGTVLDIAALGIKSVSELSRYTRPRISAGDGSTSLTLTMTARR